MSKEYSFYCDKHGYLKIEVENPPVIPRSAHCQWCTQRLLKEPREVKEQIGPIIATEGATA